MALASTARLRLTVDLQRPEEWGVRLDYDLTRRGGRPFIWGNGVLTPTGSPKVRLPLELLPILCEVDLGAQDEIVKFVRTNGPLGAWPERFLAMRADMATFGSPARIRLRPLIRARQEHAMSGTDPLGEFVDEFRVAAGGLCSLLALVLDHESGKRFSAARFTREWPESGPWPAPETRGQAWRLLVDALNAGLRSSPTQLWYVRDGQPTDGWRKDFQAGPPFILHPSAPESLYGVCVLELVDHLLAVDRPYRICANETCGRLFSMQEGRSRSGGHRTEKVKYHSTACKAMQESREYRRRQAAKGRKR